MQARLHYTNKDNLNMFIIYGECKKIKSGTCERPTWNLNHQHTAVKEIIKNFEEKRKHERKNTLLMMKWLTGNIYVCILWNFKRYAYFEWNV